MNQMVANGELKAPIVIGRDHLDTVSVASPYRETESMLDGSDAVADWPILNALLSTAGGSSWTSVHHGGGVGMGLSIHAGVVIVAQTSECLEVRSLAACHAIDNLPFFVLDGIFHQYLQHKPVDLSFL